MSANVAEENGLPTNLRIAYLVNHYPKVSHSFIRREIMALERRGVLVERVSIRGFGDQLVDAQDRDEQAKTRYVLAKGLTGLGLAALAFGIRHPRRFASAVFEGFRMAKRSDRSLPYHLVSVAEACVVLQWLERAQVRHLHAHFGTNSAEIALLVHALGGPTYSFTVHGPEEFDKPEFLGLRRKAAKASFVVAVSSFGKSQLYRWLDSADWAKVTTVHCGLEAAFHANATGAPADTNTFVSVGRLCEQKGQLVLLEACGLLKRDGVAFDLVLAGDGEMRDQVEAKIRELELVDRVRITGWISGDQVRQEILAARCLVMPSFAEGLPVAIMEALSLRRPVISTYIAGIPELVRPGREGWLVPAGDAETLALAMRECLSMPMPDLADMANGGYARVLERHDVDREAERLHQLLSRAVESAG